MENSFSSLIESASSFLILLPSKPDLDQVAAGLALYLALKERKEATISCPTEMLVEFNRLVGVNKITSELGNKNLTIKFTDYPAENVERVSADIENGKFYLTVIPKPSLSSPKKEQVELSYSGVASDTVILIGGANESHFPVLTSADLVGAKIIHIGTRTLVNSSEKNILSFARPASSVSEIIANLIEQSGLSLDPDIATNLLSGIEEGSSKFTTDSVTAETFDIFAKLLRAGGRRIPKERIIRESFPQGAIPGGIKFEKPEKKEGTPKDWLEPKIYKGTSVS
jgi:hypothetical protein